MKIRFKNPLLQRAYEQAFNNPPWLDCKKHIRKTGSSFYKAFWDGYDGKTLKQSMLAPLTIGHCIWAAGQDYKKGESESTLLATMAKPI